MDATTDTITFQVPGNAVPQPRARSTRTGRMYTPTRNGIDVFKQAISLSAALEAKRRGWRATDGPHEIHVEAVFERPPSHRTKAGELRAGVPAFPGRRAGDNDNIEKGVWDAITNSGAIWLDDCQIVGNGCRKRYAVAGEQPRTVITIRRPDG